MKLVRPLRLSFAMVKRPREYHVQKGKRNGVRANRVSERKRREKRKSVPQGVNATPSSTNPRLRMERENTFFFLSLPSPRFPLLRVDVFTGCFDLSVRSTCRCSPGSPSTSSLLFLSELLVLPSSHCGCRLFFDCSIGRWCGHVFFFVGSLSSLIYTQQ